MTQTMHQLKVAITTPRPCTTGPAIIAMALMLITSMTVLGNSSTTAEETTQSHESATERTGERYQPGDALSAISAARAKAGETNKLLLVIMGANWCHDSRALASRIETQPLQGIIEENYETVFVDVGNLDKGKDIITSLGVPVYYATPTVLIIDPVSGKLINSDDRHQWGNAANISPEDSVAYFQKMATAIPKVTATETGSKGELSSLLSEIDAFEQKQANRVYQAYAKLAPMLEAYNNGDKDKFSEEIWNEVRDFRSQVPTDVSTLRLEAHQRHAAGETHIRLKYPEYPDFSWETTPQQ